MQAFKAFIKSFEAPHRSVKIKIYVNFLSSSGIRTGRVKGIEDRPSNSRQTYLQKHAPLETLNPMRHLDEVNHWEWGSAILCGLHEVWYVCLGNLCENVAHNWKKRGVMINSKHSRHSAFKKAWTQVLLSDPALVVSGVYNEEYLNGGLPFRKNLSSSNKLSNRCLIGFIKREKEEQDGVIITNYVIEFKWAYPLITMIMPSDGKECTSNLL